MQEKLPSGGAYRLRGDGRRVAAAARARHVVEIAAERFQRVSFVINFRSRAESKPPKHLNRRAPALDRVLKKEAGDQGRQYEPLTIHRRAEGRAEQRHCGGIGLQDALDVPFAVEFCQAARYGITSGCRVAGNVLFRLATDSLVELVG